MRFGQLNALLNTDAYKASQFLQYPQGTEYVSSYLEARNSAASQVVYFGLQIFLKEYLTQPILTEDVEIAAELYAELGLPFNRSGWSRIVEHHGGYLPLKIESLAEGTLVPSGQVLLQMTNTDPHLPWLVSYMETALLRAVWYPTTVATHSRACRDLIEDYLLDTGEDLQSLEYKLHDFGARGVSSAESAAIGGLAHLLNFNATDTVVAVPAGQHYYGGGVKAGSMPAADHATITAWGREGELQAYRNMFDQFAGDKQRFAVVSDSYDLWHALDKYWGSELAEQIRSTGGTLFVRPDSGNPVDVVCRTIHKLMDSFGSSENSKGFLVLPDYIRVLQSDRINSGSIQSILERMKWERLSADNVTFGMGGDLLQRINRDTLDFTMKVSAVQVNGVWREVFKDPLTGRSKRSKKGRLALIKIDRQFATVALEELGDRENYLHLVYENGRIQKDEVWEQVRERATAPRLKRG